MGGVGVGREPDRGEGEGDTSRERERPGSLTEQAVCVMLSRDLNLTLKIMEHLQGACAQSNQISSLEGSLWHGQGMDT